MIIVNKNEGPKISYSISGNVISFRDGELTLDLEKYERDFPVHIDICENEFNMLAVGISRRYVAQIDIPAREYEFVENGTDEQGNPKYDKVAVPFPMDKVTLTLWTIEGGNA